MCLAFSLCVHYLVCVCVSLSAYLCKIWLCTSFRGCRSCISTYYPKKAIPSCSLKTKPAADLKKKQLVDHSHTENNLKQVYKSASPKFRAPILNARELP
jgi:hypothetical protein